MTEGKQHINKGKTELKRCAINLQKAYQKYVHITYNMQKNALQKIVC